MALFTRALGNFISINNKRAKMITKLKQVKQKEDDKKQ